MSWHRRLRDCLSASKLWLLALLGTDALFILFVWLLDPLRFNVLVWLMLICSLAIAILPLALLYRRQKRCDTAFDAFELEPTDDNEEILCRLLPATARPSIHKLGSLLRASRTAHTKTTLQVLEYEQYIESWAHEIKTPLALMTLLLDNRAEEISPYVQQRLQHVHNRMQADVEKILYFARLEAVHKEYCFEPLAPLDVCRVVVEEQQALLSEAHFTVEFREEGKGASEPFLSPTVISDRKGLAFILGQLISNSVKYAGSVEQPTLRFELECKRGGGAEGAGLTGDVSAVNCPVNPAKVILRISDNGPGVSQADLPFIFDKGFTGAQGNRTDHATGMGLFLVRKMAQDLVIELDAQSDPGTGLTISLEFPVVD